MRLHHPGSGESYWLHQDTTMYQVFVTSLLNEHFIIIIIIIIIIIKNSRIEKRSLSPGSRKIWKETSSLRMEVRIEGTIFAAKSERPVWKG